MFTSGTLEGRRNSCCLSFASSSLCQQPTLAGVEKQLWRRQSWHPVPESQLQCMCPKLEISSTSWLLHLPWWEAWVPLASQFCRIVPAGPAQVLLLCTRRWQITSPGPLWPTVCFYKQSFIGTQPCSFIHSAQSVTAFMLQWQSWILMNFLY